MVEEEGCGLGDASDSIQWQRYDGQRYDGQNYKIKRPKWKTPISISSEIASAN